MGRIKSTMIKKTARKLLESDITFSTDFVHNKKLLVDTMPSKKIRNKVAGYISRLVEQKKENAI
ncbi:30S ribosomal protein S17e [Candidatus Pacearchaeota archaeon]|nr:30S ribosomal protein S17e [Candidatus Pacearchaeota archaeon]|tara:strand:+ start:1209 stop:1400 length:192 start_codon:yes stop_codon:yes gene_type:complete